MGRPYKIDSDDLAGKFFVTILASSKNKRLLLKTYIHNLSSEVVYTVLVNRDTPKETTTSYLTLQAAVDIYNMAE
mgnify:CR=1 FL=1